MGVTDSWDAVKKDFQDTLYQLDLDSCNGYNTRGACVKGLPVGPIASPALESIVATIEPEDHDYLYFVAEKDGHHRFTKTYQEHLRAIEDIHRDDKK